MTVSRFPKTILMIALGGALLGRAADDRPNILFVMSDDHAAPAVSAYGGRLAEVAPTPHIDRLAREGMRFNKAFVTNSICTASRAVIMTGKYSHQNGVYNFTPLDQSQQTVSKLMQQAGYQTAVIGKWHLGSNPQGFDFWSVMKGQGGGYYGTKFVEMADASPDGRISQGKTSTYDGHAEDVVTDKALRWLRERRDPEQPFFFMLHYKAPHDRWENARRYDDYLEDVEIPIPDNFLDHGSGRSPNLDQTWEWVGNDQPDHTYYPEETGHLEGEARRRAQYQQFMKHYLRCVKGIDDNLGRVLDYLDESGLAENTIVIYTADQGFFLGEHGLYDKRFMYEEALRIPLLVRWPGRIPAGSVSEQLALNLDFPETFLDAAGAAIPGDMQGRSLLPLLDGEPESRWRQAFYYRYYFSHLNVPPHYGVRTDTHKLIYFNLNDSWELYDLEEDPREMNNLAADPGEQKTLRRLQRKLTQLQRRFGDEVDDLGQNPRTGFDEVETL